MKTKLLSILIVVGCALTGLLNAAMHPLTITSNIDEPLTAKVELQECVGRDICLLMHIENDKGVITEIPVEKYLKGPLLEYTDVYTQKGVFVFYDQNNNALAAIHLKDKQDRKEAQLKNGKYVVFEFSSAPSTTLLGKQQGEVGILGIEDYMIYTINIRYLNDAENLNNRSNDPSEVGLPSNS